MLQSRIPPIGELVSDPREELPGQTALASHAVSAAKNEIDKVFSSLEKSATRQAVITMEHARGAVNHEIEDYGSELPGYVGEVIYDNSVKPLL